MRVLDLFSGIGGFSLGLERAGMQTVAFCEIDPCARRVLADHWPEIPCHEDITTREHRMGEADVITAGFPCQDISDAGRRAGLAGGRSGLWREVIRAVRMVGPKLTLLENVAALLHRGMGEVLGDLAEIGHDAEWHCVPASAVGAPCRRDRIWIVANPHGERRETLCGSISRLIGETRAEAARIKRVQLRRTRGGGVRRLPKAGICELVTWIPEGLDEIRLTGNSVHPQIPEIIGRAILEAEAS